MSYDDFDLQLVQTGLALVRQRAGIATPAPVGSGLVELERG